MPSSSGSSFEQPVLWAISRINAADTANKRWIIEVKELFFIGFVGWFFPMPQSVVRV